MILATLIRRAGRLARFAVFAVAVIAVAACSPGAPPAFNATDITGATFARDFRLIDHHGQTRSLADFRGKAVVVFFGYTHCPDVCPTAMERFARVSRELGADAGRLQVIFISLDPERDTQALLAKYVPFFHPDFLGMTGAPADIEALAREFRVVAVKRPTEGAGGYSLDHSAGAYAYDPSGRLRLYLGPELPHQALLADLRRLISE